MPSYQYRKSHCGDKTILRPSYLHNGISYTGKTTSLYWISTLVEMQAPRLLAHHIIDVTPLLLINIVRLGQDGHHFGRQHFEMRLLDRKCVNIDLNFPKFCSLWSNPQYANIGSDNGLVPSRRKAIIWTNDDLITDAYMCHSASVS